MYLFAAAIELKVFPFAFIIALSYRSISMSILLDMSQRLGCETLPVNSVILGPVAIIGITSFTLERGTILAGWLLVSSYSLALRVIDIPFLLL